MKTEIESRFGQLIEHGDNLARSIPRDQYGLEHWIPSERITDYHAWLSSAINLIDVVAPADNHFRADAKHVMQHPDLQSGILTSVFQKILGLLKAAHMEWQQGLLRKIEYVIAAGTFDDFLDHAAMYHKANKKIEASVLASAVFEDTVRKIAQKHGIHTSGQSLEGLIDELQRASVLTPVKAKRLKGFAAVRNRSLHAEWDAFDIRDVGEAIAGSRELLADYL